MNLFRQGIKKVLTSVLSRDRMFDRGPASATGIALTFDDGPHPEYTPALLDELQRLQLRATFFVVGEAVERNPALTRRIVADGHTIGSHTYTHSEPAQTNAAKLLIEVHRSLALIEDLTGVRPTLFRPPKGKLTIAKSWGLWRLQQTIVLWNQDPRDYQASAVSGIQPWIDKYQPSRGDIILMHDTHPHCIAAIEPLVQLVQRHSLGEFATVDEWLATHKRLARPNAEELTLQTTASGQVQIPK